MLCIGFTCVLELWPWYGSSHFSLDGKERAQYLIVSVFLLWKQGFGYRIAL
jgi:hypothetical protein